MENKEMLYTGRLIIMQNIDLEVWPAGSTVLQSVKNLISGSCQQNTGEIAYNVLQSDRYEIFVSSGGPSCVERWDVIHKYPRCNCKVWVKKTMGVCETLQYAQGGNKVEKSYF